MRGKILGWLFQRTPWGRTAALALVTILLPIGVLIYAASALSEEQKQTEQNRCEFLMEKVSGIIASLDSKGRITFLNHYGRNFFGYPNDEILGKPMLGTLTPPNGFEGRDLTSFLAGLVHDPNRYAFSVNQNMLRGGKRVWIYWANKGISDDKGQVQEVLRVGLDITDRKLRLEAAARELRGVGEMLDGRSWVQRKKLKEITSRIEEKAYPSASGSPICGGVRASTVLEH